MTSADTAAAELRVAEERRRVEGVREALAGLTSWSPGYALLAACDDTLDRLDGLGGDMARPLVVVIVGACGVGKSTLLNALAHRPRLSATGPARPTTHMPVAFVRQREDAAPLEAAVAGGRLRVVVDDSGTASAHLVLVDTPDTNSVAAAEHRPTVEAVLRVADVLLCLFSAADNPKAADQLAFLSPLVAMFPKEYLYIGLTQVDRLTGDERIAVARDFARHLESAWPRQPKACYALAAKSHAEGIRCEDSFAELESELRDVLGKIDVSATVRVARARALADAVTQDARNAVDTVSSAVDSALRDVDARDREQQELLAKWLRTPVADGVVVDEVAQGMRGLMGVLFRFCRWLGRRLGAARARRLRAGTDEASSPLSPLGVLRLDVARHWPDIAARLRDAGFDSEALGNPLETPAVARVEAEVATAVAAITRKAREDAVASLTRPWKQVVLNALLYAAPVVGLLQSLWTVFVKQAELPARHLRSVAGLWFACAIVVACVFRWACGAAYRSAWRRASRSAAIRDGGSILRDVPVLGQLRKLDALRRGIAAYAWAGSKQGATGA